MDHNSIRLSFGRRVGVSAIRQLSQTTKLPTTMTMTEPVSSSASLAAEISKLLKEVDDDRADAIRLDELRKIFARLIQSGELNLHPGSTSSDTSSALRKWNQFLLQSHKLLI